MNLFLLALLGWLMSVTVQAASFDCSTAASTMEKVICETPELSKADAEMANYYFKLMKTLTAENAKELKTEQRIWLKQRQIRCQYLHSMCLLSQYGGRINELKTKYERLVPLPPTAATTFQGIRSTCSFPEVTFPEKFKIYGAGNYAGYQINKQIDSSGHRATQFDIAVNSPGEPVVLLLGAYDPSIWNISWTEGTKILAVAVTGFSRQIVIGTPPDTPILISRSFPCAQTYSWGDIVSLNRFSNEIFKREADGTFFSKNGKSVVGSPLKAGEQLLTSTFTSIDDFIDKAVPLAGQSRLHACCHYGGTESSRRRV